MRRRDDHRLCRRIVDGRGRPESPLRGPSPRGRVRPPENIVARHPAWTAFIGSSNERTNRVGRAWNPNRCRRITVRIATFTFTVLGVKLCVAVVPTPLAAVMVGLYEPAAFPRRSAGECRGSIAVVHDVTPEGKALSRSVLGVGCPVGVTLTCRPSPP